LDMYGDGRSAEDLDGAMALYGEAMADPAAMRARFEAALVTLREQPGVDADRIAAIGYCFGGTVVTQMALDGLDLQLVASFHGGLAVRPPEPPVPVTAKVLVCHGEADVLVPPETVAAFKAAMAQGGAQLEFVNYPGAMHGFSNPGATEKGRKFDMPVAYDAATDADSWQRLQQALQAL
ncbi:MAG: dienelactone hydrolase family protein, partial [Spongiibacteraceae bacterium]|nr:dienelactone hydrolase family protein [Spongiibacteraceae bacterium]